MTLPRIRHNIAALGGVQVANYLIPLLTVPYLTRVLGLEAWGRIAFAQVILLYFIQLVDYGFSWSAVSQVSVVRQDRKAVSEIFSATWTAQWLLLGLSGLILGGMVAMFPLLENDWRLYGVGFFMVLGHVLFPLWLLQGLEQLRVAAIIQVCSKTTLLAVFVVVRDPGDVVLAMAVRSLVGVVSGVLCLYWIGKSRIVQWRRPSAVLVWQVFKEGGELFVSRAWISFYTIMIPTVLGLVAGTTAVGIYNLADRVRKVAQSLLQPISEAVFPRMSYLYTHDRTNARSLLGKSMLTVALVAGGAGLSIFIAADWVILVLGGEAFQGAAVVLRWLAPVPLVVGLSNVFGVQVMIPNHRIKAFNLIVGAAGAWAVLLVYPIVNRFGAMGAGAVTLSSELLVTGLMACYLWRYGYFKAVRTSA